MRIRLALTLVVSCVMALAFLQGPAAWAQGDRSEREIINHLQNKLHQTDDASRRKHLEHKIDHLQDHGIHVGASGAHSVSSPFHALP